MWQAKVTMKMTYFKCKSPTDSDIEPYHLLTLPIATGGTQGLQLRSPTEPTPVDPPVNVVLLFRYINVFRQVNISLRISSQPREPTDGGSVETDTRFLMHLFVSDTVIFKRTAWSRVQQMSERYTWKRDADNEYMYVLQKFKNVPRGFPWLFSQHLVKQKLHAHVPVLFVSKSLGCLGSVIPWHSKVRKRYTDKQWHGTKQPNVQRVIISTIFNFTRLLDRGGHVVSGISSLFSVKHRGNSQDRLILQGISASELSNLEWCQWAHIRLSNYQFHSKRCFLIFLVLLPTDCL